MARLVALGSVRLDGAGTGFYSGIWHKSMIGSRTRRPVLRREKPAACRHASSFVMLRNFLRPHCRMHGGRWPRGFDGAEAGIKHHVPDIRAIDRDIPPSPRALLLELPHLFKPA